MIIPLKALNNWRSINFCTTHQKHPHVQPNDPKQGHTYRVMRGKVAWGILGYGFIGKASSCWIKS